MSDAADREWEVSPYVAGACFAKGFKGARPDRWHFAHEKCDFCDAIRRSFSDPEFAAEFIKGKRETESWMRMHDTRRNYHRRRRYW